MTFFDEQPDGDIHGECAAEIGRLTQERDALAVQNEVMRGLLIAGLPVYGAIGSRDCDVTAKREAFEEALALPDTSADILRARDARALRDAAEICDEENSNWAHNGASHAADVLRWKADKLEQKNG